MPGGEEILHAGAGFWAEAGRGEANGVEAEGDGFFADLVGLGHGKQASLPCLKTKKQKNRIRGFARAVDAGCAEGTNGVFWFFFAKKNTSLPYPRPRYPGTP
jgi:hypothetical protein